MSDPPQARSLSLTSAASTGEDAASQPDAASLRRRSQAALEASLEATFDFVAAEDMVLEGARAAFVFLFFSHSCQRAVSGTNQRFERQR